MEGVLMDDDDGYVEGRRRMMLDVRARPPVTLFPPPHTHNTKHTTSDFKCLIREQKKQSFYTFLFSLVIPGSGCYSGAVHLRMTMTHRRETLLQVLHAQ